jgi:hypothetical protein
MISVPKYFNDGVQAAHVGVAMSTIATPMGFTFCPHRNESVERWNFMGGCVLAYMGTEEQIRGEFPV